MSHKRFENRKLQTLVHSGITLASMGLILGGLGWMAAGAAGSKLAVITAILWFWLTPQLPPRLVMGALGARPVHPRLRPDLYRILYRLARRAGLNHVPTLYLMPLAAPNAFASGTRQDSGICISSGLLKILDSHEMEGILGHEIAHIRNNDILVMGAAAVFGRLIHYLSLAGQVIMVLCLPLMILGVMNAPLWPFLFLVLAPTLSLYLHLALSRVREYNADLDSAALTGHPGALASALAKIRAFQKKHTMGRLKRPAGTMLNTHPPTENRIGQLLALTAAPRKSSKPMPNALFLARSKVP